MRAFIYFDMGIMELPPKQKDEIIARLSPDQEVILSGTPIPTAVKGYELNSWRAGDEWYFTLITGMNRSKNIDEIVSRENVIVDSGWVKLTVQDVQSLKLILGSLPRSAQILWLVGKLVESSGDPNIIRFPPKAVIKQLLQYSRQQGLNLQFDQ